MIVARVVMVAMRPFILLLHQCMRCSNMAYVTPTNPTSSQHTHMCFVLSLLWHSIAVAKLQAGSVKPGWFDNLNTQGWWPEVHGLRTIDIDECATHSKHQTHVSHSRTTYGFKVQQTSVTHVITGLLNCLVFYHKSKALPATTS